MVRARRTLYVLLVVAVLLFVTGGTAYAAGTLTRYTAQTDELVDQVAAALLVGLLVAALVGQLTIGPALARRARRAAAIFPDQAGTDSPLWPFSLSPDSGRSGPIDDEQWRRDVQALRIAHVLGVPLDLIDRHPQRWGDVS